MKRIWLYKSILFLILFYGISPFLEAQVAIGKGGINKLKSVTIVRKTITNASDGKVQLTAITRNIKKVLSYKWEGLNGYSTGSQTQNKYILHNLKPGKYIIYVTVTDDVGYIIKSDPFHLTVIKNKTEPNPQDIPVNKHIDTLTSIQEKPLLNIAIKGPNIIKETDEKVILTAVIPNNMKITSYNWEQPKGQKANLQNTTNKELAITGLKVGNYEFKLKVTGDQKQVGEAALSITVQEGIKPNYPPSVKIAEAIKSITLPTTSTYISCNATDPDGYIISYKWEKLSGRLCKIINDTISIINITNLEEGYYSFKVTVKNDKGLTSSAIAELNVRPAAISYVTKPPLPSNLKGGPGNAFLNVLIPGLGHYYVSGDYTGKGKKGSSFIISLAYFGSAAGALYYKLKSDKDYQTYTGLAKYRETQLDATGNIIGIRGGSEANAQVYYDNAQTSNKYFLTLASIGAGILASDFLYTIIKGSKNKKHFNKEVTIKKGLSYDYEYKKIKLGVEIKF